MCQISFDQKFGKPQLTQMQYEQNGCPVKLNIMAIFGKQQGE